MSATGPPLEDDTADIAASLYYFKSKDEPVFADVFADRTSNASSLSYFADFRKRIIKRDGTCVCTNETAAESKAYHIIPHSKGDHYIQNVPSYHDNTDELDGIDDTRNGFLLWTPIYQKFGNGSLAFLKTPNLYLTVDDIPPDPCREENPMNRITVHHIVESELGILLPGVVPNNCDLRELADTSECQQSLKHGLQIPLNEL